MGAATLTPEPPHPGSLLEPHPSLPDRRFEAVIFDWDGTAVPDRTADAFRVRGLIEALCALGMEVAVVSGTHVGNIDGQLRARPRGPGHLRLCLNRGSEVFLVDEAGVHLVYRRIATPQEERALTAAASQTVARLAERGLQAQIVSQRLNRRKIDLIPEPAWTDPPKARLAQLLAAVEARLHRFGFLGLPQVAELARDAAQAAGLPEARVTSDAKHVEIGLTDKADSARWILRDLWVRGVGPGLVLIVGDEMGPLGGLPGSDSLMLVEEARRATAVSLGAEPGGVPPGVVGLGGGPEAFLDLLEDQLQRRRFGEVPGIDMDPAWTLIVEGLDSELERVHESQLTLADGRIGTSGSPLLGHPATTPMVLAAGVFRGDGSESEILRCPVWNQLPGEAKDPRTLHRVLDLHTGLLRQELSHAGKGSEAVLFSSAARPGTVALRVEGPSDVAKPGSSLALADGQEDEESGEMEGRRWARAAGSGGGVVAAAREGLSSDAEGSVRLERLAAYVTASARIPTTEEALRSLEAAERAGFESLLLEHRAAWARRWEEADVVIEGDPDLQLAVRFALFHLMSSVADSEEAAVGARGLSGPAYRGHVFWDADVFVLPFLAATHPPSARAMLEYRIRRLPAALEAARTAGRRGARFPWESASTGQDVTPGRARDRSGRWIGIRTGQLEEHIVADVAWAAGCYLDWTGDEPFARGPGQTLLVETARYWASRIRRDAEGGGHIDGVIGPDEYHEAVDDNAFTNVMARWNLCRAAAIAIDPGYVSEAERENWRQLGESLADGWDPSTGLYQQFHGFFDLEPLIIKDVAPHRPIAADLLLGRDRVGAAQVIKQADVLMLHHLVPEEVAPGSLCPNLDFYEPRTAQGSSLSPGVHAALFARAGFMDEALASLRLASRIDLDDLTGSTAGGLHLGAMGSVWQALAWGFLGLRPKEGALQIDPRLPPQWKALEVAACFRGSRLHLRAEPGSLLVRTDSPVTVAVGGSAPGRILPPCARFLMKGDRWEGVDK